MKTVKSFNEKTIELINRNDVKELKNEIYFNTEIGDTLLILVSKNSNDFTKDIASKQIDLNNDKEISEKQAWCVAFQIKNNIEVYKLAIVDFDNECKDALNKVNEEREVVEVIETKEVSKEILEFREQYKKEQEIINEFGFFYVENQYNDELIFVNPCGKDETNFTKFSKFITEKTTVSVSESKVKELYDMQRLGFKGYVNVDENHYLFCPIIDNGFSIRLCVGNQKTMAV